MKIKAKSNGCIAIDEFKSRRATHRVSSRKINDYEQHVYCIKHLRAAKYSVQREVHDEHEMCEALHAHDELRKKYEIFIFYSSFDRV